MKNRIQFDFTASIFVVVLMLGAFLVRPPSVYSQTLGTKGKSTDDVVDLDRPEWRQSVPVSVLVNESRFIAIGRALRNACHSSQDGSRVTTDYQIQIQNVLKGDLQPDSVISVSMPGGLLNQANGRVLVVRSRYVRKMQNDRTYLMFLADAPAGGNAPLTVVRGSQGLYEVPANGDRLIHLGRSFDLPPADDGPMIEPFLASVRTLVAHP